jgi:Tol biopolymer transport system component
LKNCAGERALGPFFALPVAMLVFILVRPAELRAQSPHTTTGDGASRGVSSRSLLIVFSSLRQRPAFASLYLYRHDGVDEGGIVAEFPTASERGDTHPSLTADGAFCLYTSKQVGGFSPQLQLFDVSGRQLLPGPAFNAQFAARTDASLSGRGDLVAFCAWDQPGQSGGWDVMLYDRRAASFVDLPGLNSADNEREVAISGDGRFLAFVSDRPGSLGLSDIYLYDRDVKQCVLLPGVNSPRRELNPTLSHDGLLLAFVSDRPGGQGGKDVYVVDRQTGEVVSPAGLNSSGHEQTPTFSPDGRYLAFVSERVSGEGERDVYLYDRSRGQLLATPGLNSTAEDFDPAISWAP